MESYNIFLASVGYDVVLSFAHSAVKSVQSPERPLGTGCPTDKYNLNLEILMFKNWPSRL